MQPTSDSPQPSQPRGFGHVPRARAATTAGASEQRPGRQGALAEDLAAKAPPLPAAADTGDTGDQQVSRALMVGLALVCTLLWAGAQIGVKYGLLAAPPLALMGMRFVAASLVLLPVIRLAKSPWPRDARGWGRTVVLGLLNNTVYLGLTALGIAEVSAGLACVLTGLNPLLLALGGALFFREALRLHTLLGFVGALMGVSWVMAARLGSDNTLRGALFVIAANVVMVAGNLLYKRWQNDCGLLVSHSIQLIVGGATLLAISAATEPWSAIVWGRQLLLAELFLIFGVSFGAMLTWLFLLKHGSASQAGVFLFLVPLFGLAEGALLLGEHLSRVDMAGAALTTLCIWYAQRSPKTAAA